MYEIYKLNEDLYQVHSSFRGEQAMEGTLLAILTYCVHKLGFDPNELEAGMIEMIRNDVDAAHFGINRTFIYGFNRSERAKVS